MSGSPRLFRISARLGMFGGILEGLGSCPRRLTRVPFWKVSAARVGLSLLAGPRSASGGLKQAALSLSHLRTERIEARAEKREERSENREPKATLGRKCFAAASSWHLQCPLQKISPFGQNDQCFFSFHLLGILA